MEIINLIKKCAIFAAIPEERLHNMAAESELINLSRNDILLSRNDKPDNAYLLTNGRLESFLAVENNGEPTWFDSILPGELVGEIGVLSGEPRMLSILAAEESTLVKIPREAFMACAHENPEILYSILQLVSRRAQSTIHSISGDACRQRTLFFPLNNQAPLSLITEGFQKNLNGMNDIQFLDITRNSPVTLSEGSEKIKHSIVFADSLDILRNLLEKREIKTLYLVAGSSENPVMDPALAELINQPGIPPKVLVMIHPDSTLAPSGTSFWLQQTDFERWHHVKESRDKDYQRIIRFILDKAVGLVLGGGGLKGWLHVGLLKALETSHVPIDMINGVSAGSLIGACYSSTEDYVRAQEKIALISGALQTIFKIKHLTWPLLSVFDTSSAIAALESVFGNSQIEDLWTPFHCLSSNYSTSSEAVHMSGEIRSILMASNSLPGLFPPVILQGQIHYDGGLINNLPVDIMRSKIGYRNRVIASSLSGGSNKTTYQSNALPPGKVTLSRFLKSRLSKQDAAKYPGLLNTLIESLLLGSAWRETLNAASADYLVHADLGKYSIYQQDETERNTLFDLGYQLGLDLISKHFQNK